MDFEHTYTERPAQASSLEETARRSAKAAAWSLGIHVADPEGTMKQMFQKFIGSKLQRQEERCQRRKRRAKQALRALPAPRKRKRRRRRRRRRTKEGKKGEREKGREG
ncbi:unnamed protein product [Effrenium voratum]|nr:unnamed protein product [Effrenium voratum]